MKYLVPGSIVLVFLLAGTWFVDNIGYYRGMREGDRRARAAAVEYGKTFESDARVNLLEAKVQSIFDDFEPRIQQLQGIVNNHEERISANVGERPVYVPPSVVSVHPSAPRTNGRYVEYLARYNNRTRQSQKWNGEEWLSYSDDEVPPPPPPFDEGRDGDGWQQWLVTEPVTGRDDSMRWVRLKPEP